jgi:DNA polymerase
MSILTVDFETYYDTDFSLTKLATEEYIRSPRFETIGVSVKVDGGKAVWYPQPEVEEALAAINWSEHFMLAQNTAFDAAILAWRYNAKPKGLLDTLGMSRALFPHERSHSLAKQAERARIGEKGTEVLNAKGKRFADFSELELLRYGEYCCNDSDLTYTLFNKYMAMGFPRQELELIDLTLKMFVEPLLVLEESILRKHYDEVVDSKQTLLEQVRDIMLADSDVDFIHQVFTEGTPGIKKLLMSNDKFATVLRQFGVEPPMKKSPTTGKPAYAFAKTDEAFKLLEEHPDYRIQHLVAARLGNKSTIEETRTLRFIDMSHRGAFPVPLRYYGAHSGRWSGQDMINLQNLPSRGQNAGKIKKAIMAPPGYVVIDCDSSQIEARVLAWLAGQINLVSAFERKEDVYKLMAMQMYNVSMEEIDYQKRQVGKTVILGAGYGVGALKLQLFLKTQAKVDVSGGEAKRIVDAYRRMYSMIPALWRQGEEALRALAMGNGMVLDAQGLIEVIPDKGLKLPNGLFIQYPELSRFTADDGKAKWEYKSKGLSTGIYGGKVIENICQAVARIIIGEQMLRIKKRYPVVLTVHDAIAVVAKEHEAAAARAFVEDCMRWVPKWATGLPLACESGIGVSYGDC